MLRTHFLLARKIIEYLIDDLLLSTYGLRISLHFLRIKNKSCCEVNAVATYTFKINISAFLLNSCDLIAMAEFQTTRNREKI